MQKTGLANYSLFLVWKTFSPWMWSLGGSQQNFSWVLGHFRQKWFCWFNSKDNSIQQSGSHWYWSNRKKSPKIAQKVFKIDKKETYHQKWQISIQNMIQSFILRWNSIQRIIQYVFFQEYSIQKIIQQSFFPENSIQKMIQKFWFGLIQFNKIFI